MYVAERDALWLGDEDGIYGPAARAALGILLESGRWTWWENPSATIDDLERAIAGQSVVAWGGDPSVLEAENWVDSIRGIALGRAFHALVNIENRPRIKVAREVWSWSADAVGGVVKELTQLVGPGHVFPDWERDIKPRFPERQLAQQGRRVVTSPSLARDELLSQEHDGIEWVDDYRVPDIVVVDSLGALDETVAAKLVIVYGQDLGSTLREAFSIVRRELYAQCAIHVDAQAHDIGSWLSAFLTSWATSGNSVSRAVEIAAAQSGLWTQVVSTTQSFFINKRTFVRRPPKAYATPDPNRGGETVTSAASEEVPRVLGRGHGTREAPTAQDGSDSAVKAPETPAFLNEVEPHSMEPTIARQRVVSARPGPPVERVLNARARQGNRELQRWPESGTAGIDIDIRAKTPLQRKVPVFPDDQIEWQGDHKQLQVHLFELGCEPITQTLDLTKASNSTVASFVRQVDARSVDLRFLVSDGARILQTARFQTAPGEPIKFFIESLVTPVAHDKESFDVALLVNDSLGAQPSVSVITGDGKPYFSPLSESQTKDTRDEILAVLEQAVANPNALLRPLMMQLANLGSLLLTSLRSAVPNWPGTVGRVQLVTQSDAFFPIEYLYDGEVPESSGAPLCPDRHGCLDRGSAIVGCPIRAARECLCPMGFLGVSGIVERHVWQAGTAAHVWAHPGQAKSQRLRIESLSKIAFAASDRADRINRDAAGVEHAVTLSSIESTLNVQRIPDWRHWKQHIAQQTPSMLLLIVHLQNQAIHVGADDGLNLAAINTHHIGTAPVVIAVGCSSGRGEIPGGSLPAILQRKGARVVVAAMTGVLGRHANRFGRDLAEQLRAMANSPGPRYVGEAVSELRRRLLADDLALGLAVVAFGDADVELGTQPVLVQ